MLAFCFERAECLLVGATIQKKLHVLNSLERWSLLFLSLYRGYRTKRVVKRGERLIWRKVASMDVCQRRAVWIGP